MLAAFMTSHVHCSKQARSCLRSPAVQAAKILSHPPLPFFWGGSCACIRTFIVRVCSTGVDVEYMLRAQAQDEQLEPQETHEHQGLRNATSRNVFWVSFRTMATDSVVLLESEDDLELLELSCARVRISRQIFLPIGNVWCLLRDPENSSRHASCLAIPWHGWARGSEYSEVTSCGRSR